MNFDFPTILTSLVFVSGLIWAIDAIAFAPKRRALTQDPNADEVLRAKAHREPTLVEYARSFFPVFLVVLVLRSFMVEPFRIPSGSMMPTLLTGDFIMVNKFTYGIRLPVINKKIIEMNYPARGDVAVFRFPENPSIDFIKRIVGVPGDKIEYHRKTLFVNGEPQKLEKVGIYRGEGSGLRMSGAYHLTEQLTGLSHDILVDARAPDLPHGCNVLRPELSFTVPKGHYFVMGDNRDNSNDSRCWGTVPDENLVGKAFMIWFNWDVESSGPDWGRIGTSIK